MKAETILAEAQKCKECKRTAPGEYLLCRVHRIKAK